MEFNCPETEFELVGEFLCLASNLNVQKHGNTVKTSNTSMSSRKNIESINSNLT
jgi:hypothetical protein